MDKEANRKAGDGSARPDAERARRTAPAELGAPAGKAANSSVGADVRMVMMVRMPERPRATQPAEPTDGVARAGHTEQKNSAERQNDDPPQPPIETPLALLRLIEGKGDGDTGERQDQTRGGGRPGDQPIGITGRVPEAKANREEVQRILDHPDRALPHKSLAAEGCRIRHILCPA